VKGMWAGCGGKHTGLFHRPFVVTQPHPCEPLPSSERLSPLTLKLRSKVLDELDLGLCLRRGSLAVSPATQQHMHRMSQEAALSQTIHTTYFPRPHSHPIVHADPFMISSALGIVGGQFWRYQVAEELRMPSDTTGSNRWVRNLWS